MQYVAREAWPDGKDNLKTDVTDRAIGSLWTVNGILGRTIPNADEWNSEGDRLTLKNTYIDSIKTMSHIYAQYQHYLTDTEITLTTGNQNT